MVLDVGARALSQSGVSGGNAKNRTIVYFRESTIVNLDFSIVPLWCEMEGNVVVGESIELAKLGTCNGNQSCVVGRLRMRCPFSA